MEKHNAVEQDKVAKSGCMTAGEEESREKKRREDDSNVSYIIGMIFCRVGHV